MNVIHLYLKIKHEPRLHLKTNHHLKSSSYLKIKHEPRSHLDPTNPGRQVQTPGRAQIPPFIQDGMQTPELIKKYEQIFHL